MADAATSSPTPPTTTSFDVEAYLRQEIAEAEATIEKIKAKHTERAEGRSEKYRWVVIASLVVLPIFAALGWWLLPSQVDIGGAPFNTALLPWLLVVLYVLISLRKVDTDEIAGADFFGEPTKQFSAGLAYVPRFLLGLTKERRTVVQAQYPGDADDIFWGEEKDDLPANKVRPIYATTAERGTGNPLDDRNNIGFSLYSRHALEDDETGQFFRFVRNIAPIEQQETSQTSMYVKGAKISPRMHEVLRQLRDTGENQLKSIIGRLTMAEIVQHWQLISRCLTLKLQAAVLPWGVKVIEAGLVYVNPGHRFNESIQSVPKARFAKQATITEAEGEKERLSLEGAGKAEAERLLLIARADGAEKIRLVAVKKSGDVAVSSDVARQLANSGNVVAVGTGGVSELLGIIAAAKKTGG